jgi:hypothetical protein
VGGVASLYGSCFKITVTSELCLHVGAYYPERLFAASIRKLSERWQQCIELSGDCVFQPESQSFQNDPRVMSEIRESLRFVCSEVCC